MRTLLEKAILDVQSAMKLLVTHALEILLMNSIVRPLQIKPLHYFPH